MPCQACGVAALSCKICAKAEARLLCSGLLLSNDIGGPASLTKPVEDGWVATVDSGSRLQHAKQAMSLFSTSSVSRKDNERFVEPGGC